MYSESIGEVLAETRRKLGKNLKEVEFDTKIRGKYIEALERDDFEYLPGEIYAKGFIKTYALYLGIDPLPLIQQYNALYIQQQQQDYDLSHMSSNLRVATKKRPRWFKPAVALGAAAAIFVTLIAWGAYVSNTSNKQQVIVQDIKTRTTTDTTVAAATTSTTKKSIAAADSDAEKNRNSTTTTTKPKKETKGDGKIDVVVKLTGINNTGSWVRVKVDGERAFEGLIQHGESKVFKGDETVQVRAGNAPGLEVMLNGKRLPQLETVKGIADKTFKKESSNGQR